MKILLSNAIMDSSGGTQTWTRTMFDQLSREHEVHLHSSTQNTFAPEIPPWRPGQTYDIGLLNHNAPFRDLRRVDIRARIVTVHGVLPALEQPAPWADAYVSVSEEIQAALPFRSTIIRNPIDTARFKCAREPNSQIENILVSSNYQGDALDVVLRAARQMDARVRVIGKGNQVADPRDLVCWSDIVFGLGRTALEAMAAGRAVFCFDYLGGEGLITPDNVYDLRRSNFSGRIRQLWYTPEELHAALSLIDPKSRSLAPYVRAEHEAEMIAAKYLELAASIRSNPALAMRNRVHSVILQSHPKFSSPRVSRLVGRSGSRGQVLSDAARERARGIHNVPKW